MPNSHQSYTLKIAPFNGLETHYYFNQEGDLYPARFFPAHIHNELEIYILLEGNVSFIVEKNSYTLSPGDAIITKPNELHNCVLNQTSTHKHICFWFSADEDNPLLKKFLSTEFGCNNYYSAKSDRMQILKICEEIINVSGETDSLALFSLITQMLSFYSTHLSSVKLQNNDFMPQQMKDILDYINKYFTDIERVEEIAQHFFISQSTLLRMFKKYVHTTPVNYLETKRLAYSRFLLSRGETILSASMKAGYVNVSNYIRLFKKRFGITPKQYVRRL